MRDDDTDRHDAWELFETKHHPAEIFYGVFAFLFATWLLTQMGSQTKYFANLPLSKQPALWSGIAIIGMIVFGTLEVFFYWRRNSRFETSELWPELTFWLRAIEYFGWFMAYVVAVPVIGYLPATIVFCVLLTARLGYRSPRVHVAAIGVAIGTVVLFKSILQVKIPGGQIYEYLPDAIRNFMILYL